MKFEIWDNEEKISIYTITTGKSDDISVVLEGFGNRTTLYFSKETWNRIAKVVSEAWRSK